jgi:hypothetical protein
MKYILTRRYNKNNTLSILRDESGNEICRIGEPPQSVIVSGKEVFNVANRCCIPEGIYNVRKHNSPKFGRCFAFKDSETKPRGNILIHSGNFFADYKTNKTDSHGCLIVGEKFADLNGDKLIDVVNSKATLKKLLLILPDEFEFEIISEK